MADERKYREDEVREIFALATDEDGAGLPALAEQEGLTLGELREVGREVGLNPDRVTEAAAMLNARSELLPGRTSLGAPVSVGRVVELPRAATDREWQVLVAELRETFGARGRVTSHGDTREWTNGNLQAFLEPTEAGHRLRLGTHKVGTAAVTVIGALGLVIGLLLLATSGLDERTFGAAFATLIPALFALAGGGALAGNLVRLRRWAGERERQMEHIADRARALLEAPLFEKDSEI
ncbi:MAG: hypothetical protein ABFS14_04025 [Gemmatimonadota bacterium]